MSCYREATDLVRIHHHSPQQDIQPKSQTMDGSSTNDSKRLKQENAIPYENWKSLLECIVSNDMDKFNKIIINTDRDELVDCDDDTGMTLLMASASMGRKDMIASLLEYGCPWNAIDRKGMCAGDYAVKQGHQDCVDELVNAGVRAELLFAEMEENDGDDDEDGENGNDSKEYLQNRAVYDSNGNLVDSNQEGVMMPWETPLMSLHAKSLYDNTAGGKESNEKTFSCLNIGFGLGIIDSEFQKLNPNRHVIVEAHPDVYKRMLDEGWDKKKGVEIYFGRWQDRIPELVKLAENEKFKFDGVFFDTYGEHYSKDMRKFHGYLPQLMSKNGCYSFFNGFCPRSRFFQGVACQVVQLELEKLGFDSVGFTPVDISDGFSSGESHSSSASESENGSVWKNVKTQYFFDNTYYMPLAKWGDGEVAEEDAQASA